jgi:hypothetical protein
MAVGDLRKATEFGNSGDMLHGTIRWEFGSAITSRMDELTADEAFKLGIDIDVALAQALEAISVLINDPTATSYDKVNQPVFDGIRSVLQGRGVVPK